MNTVVERRPLPIDALLPELQAAMRTAPTLVLQAAPGTGKTTRVPPALLDAVQGRILVLEPRRLAARLSAERVASELGEECGRTCGYQIRFERRATDATRILFLTEGLFLRLVNADPALTGVGCVVLDEFHERNIHTDVALAVVRRLQESRRPDLRLVVMSATLDVEALTSSLSGALSFQCPGRTFPVETEHLAPNAPPRTRPELAVADAVVALAADPRCGGHILVFLPGVREILDCQALLRDLPALRSWQVLGLWADAPRAQQDAVFAQSPERKVILSTNVAETSITIDGVTGVVDTGTAKTADWKPWSGIPTLQLKPISKSAAVQRAGRAGRTASGVCRRLYTQFEFNTRPAFDKPDLHRADLAPIALDLLAALQALAGTPLRFAELARLPWLEPPLQNSLDAAAATLNALGALDAEGKLTETGRKLARFSLHPRLGRVVLEGVTRGIEGAAVWAAALLNEGMLLRRGPQSDLDIAHCDVAFELKILLNARAGRGRSGVQTRDLQRIEQVARQIATAAGLSPRVLDLDAAQVPEAALSACLLRGFPDRVAQVKGQDAKGGARRTGTRPAVQFCLGGTAQLAEASVVQNAPLIVALDAEEISGGAAGSRVLVRLATAVEAEQLLDLGNAMLRNETDYQILEPGGRVRLTRRTLYGNLVLEERELGGETSAIEEVLLAELRKRWPKKMENDDSLDQYECRRQLAQEHGFELDLPDLRGEDFDLLLLHLTEGKRSLAEIDAVDLGDAIEELLPNESARKLAEAAPRQVTLKSGRKAKVHYAAGKPPWVEARLQDFFGTAETPSILKGRMRCVVHLLAPNGQAVQVTADLAGFWKKDYPEVRKDLSRRYPRHGWPEDPTLPWTPPPRRGPR